MKKIILAAAITLVSFSSFAQFDLGVKAGLNFTELDTKAGSIQNIYNESVKTKTGYSFGVFARFGKKLYVQPEIMVVSRKAELSFSTTPVDVKFTNIDVPVLVGWSPVKRFRVNAGPVVSLKVAEDQKIKDAFNSYIKDTDSIQKNAVLGYQVGIGTHLLGFDFDLRKEGGLSDVTAFKLPNGDNFSQRSKGWQFSVGFKFL
jgi:Outer membrane protein beta-barrel domain